MCIIIAKPLGAEMPPIETLRYCAQRNPDGFGFAIPGKVYKSMNFETFYKELKKTVTPDTAAIIHFRYATHGRPCKSNCHPFRDDDLGVSFAHNGVLPIVPFTGKTDSETAFRGLIAPKMKLYGIDSKEARNEILSVIGGSRFAIMTDDGEIRLFGRFISDGGCWYSNENYRPYNFMYNF